MSVSDQPVRNKHAMAAKVNALGAHVGGARSLRQSDEFSHGILEFSGKHVVGVVAEAGVAKGEVGRIVANFFAVAAKSRHPQVTDSGGRQAYFKGVAIELRQPPGRREGADIDQSLNLVGLKSFDQIFECAS